MTHGIRSIGIGIAAAALFSAGASADLFNFAAVPDGATATYETPIVVTDPGNPALTASISPALPGGFLTKNPPMSDFPQASGGFLQDISFTPVGARINFNRTVFCVPGMIIGIIPDPEMRYFGSWSTQYKSEDAAADEFDVTISSGLLQLGAFTMPDHLIDSIEIHAYMEPLAGGPRTELPLSMGDFFAIALSCRTDMDGSESVDVFDLLAYLDEWFAASEWAERTDDAVIDVFDLLAYLDLWFAGGC